MAGKNNIFGKAALVLALAAVFAGCEKHQISEEDHWAELCGDKPLRFASAVAETKATSPLVDGSTFGVFAFLQEGVIGSTTAHWSDGGWNSAFMFNQKVEKTAGQYTYSPIRYWPENEENTISFWAYSPYNASAVLYEAGTTNTYTKTSTGLPDIKFSVTNGRDDFMTSNLVVDKTYDNCTNHDGVVDFEFDHRLAWVEFKAQPAADYSVAGITLTVTSIKIVNDYSSAVYRQSTSSWNSYSTERTEANAVTAFSGSVQLEYDTVNDVPIAKSCSNYPVLMLPQDMDHGSGNKKVTVIINYNQNDGTFNLPKQGIVELDGSMIDAWEKNKKYVYTFTISSGDAISLKVQVQPWEYWLGTSDYTENVTITKQLAWDSDTYEAGTGSNCTEEASFTIDGVASTYKVVVLKPGSTLKGSFIFDTPYLGTWYAMLEPINGSIDGSIVFTNNSVLCEGTVGSESTIEIKASGAATTAQYAVLRFMCRTVPADSSDPASAQTLYVQPDLLGGQFIIKQNIN